MQVIFYKCTSPPEYVNKSLTQLATVDATIYGESSIVTPALYIKTYTTILSCNYCYIPQFGRYYYCEITIENGGSCIVNCRCDVLQTAKNYIKNNKAVVIRNEYVGSSYIYDEQIPTDTRQNVEVYKFGTSPFNIDVATSSNYNFCLNVAGGGEGET